MGAESISPADLTEASEKWQSDLQELGQFVSGIDASPEFCRELANLERCIEEQRGELDAFDFISGLYPLGPGRSKIWESEIFHSNLLAWLLNPRENHGVGVRFLKGFLGRTQAPDEMLTGDWYQATVIPEWRNSVRDETGDDETVEDETKGDETGNDENRAEKIGFLDLLVVSLNAKSLCAIENKVLSSEHSEQLTRYRRALESRYPDFKRHYVFLTPKRDLPEKQVERGYWQSAGYSTVQRLVQESADAPPSSVTDEAPAFLKQYATTLRRNIVPDTSARDLARRIYLEHRTLFDQVFESRPNIQSELKQRLEAVIARHPKLKPLEKVFNNQLPFEPADWKVLADVQNTTAGRNRLLVFRCYLKGINAYIDLGMNAGKTKDIRMKVFETVKQKTEIFRGDFDHETLAPGWITLHQTPNILDEADYANWDTLKVREKIDSFVSDFAEKEMPKMSEIIADCLSDYHTK